MPPSQGTLNAIEGPGDYTTTKDVHSDTYAAIDPAQHDLSGNAFRKAGASFIALAARSDLTATEAAVKDAAKAAGRPETKVLQLKLDVSSIESVSAAIAEIETTFGRLDVVVNNAGILTMGLVADSDPDEWWRIFEVNLKGPYLVARACLPLLLKSENGLKQILTVSRQAFQSTLIVGAHKVDAGISAYQSSKLAVLRVTQFIGAEYADQGLTAITIHPGNIPNEIAGNIDDLPDMYKNAFTETNELPADTIIWLTAKKREWLNGRYVNVTWDMPQLEAKREKIVEGDRLKVKLDVDF